MYPIVFIPDYKERVWGGEALNQYYHKHSPFAATGESWEVACHPNGMSTVKNGAFQGQTLEELLLAHGDDVLGRPFTVNDRFPLLVKLIDAKDKLSVQVHPDDDYAFAHENGELGKSEAWYVLQARPGASLIAGLKSGVRKADFVTAIEQNQIETCLNSIPVQAGDVLNIPAGLIHAIGDGIILAEVQQNSDTTYRVYDWNRVGLDGQARELHIAKSLAVIDFDGRLSTQLCQPTIQQHSGYKEYQYVQNDYFSLDRIVISEQYLVTNCSYQIYLCIAGECQIEAGNHRTSVQTGESFLIPASLPTALIKSHNAQLIKAVAK